MDIVLYLILPILGFSVGYLLKGTLTRKSSGVIYVSHHEEKTLYSLELGDYPETLQFKKQIVFKVKNIDETLEDVLNRE